MSKLAGVELDAASLSQLEALARLIRYYILISSTAAGSGHPTSSLSATELMTGLLFGKIFRYKLDAPDHPNNDRLIFSKGHASPLFYALWGAAGQLTEAELLTFREFDSPLEGHPSMRFRYTEAATGSLGQGLAIGVGLAVNARNLDNLPYRTYVLLGDSEMAEGSQWEAIQLAAHYGLDNLVGVIDVNRLGQRGETMYGHDLIAYEKRLSAFGWDTIVIDGHSLPEVVGAYQQTMNTRGRPTMIIARTIKGKGFSLVENKNGWHGKALDKDQLAEALKELGPVDKSLRGQIAEPEDLRPATPNRQPLGEISYPAGKEVPTRNGYGNGLLRAFPHFPEIVSVDGEVSNSTRAEQFKEAHPDRFFEMYIAEQNMVGVALGLSARGKIPFASSFAAFLTRAYDQIRMSQYSDANIKFVGSHAGVSIGEDGPSQMGLEDIAMFRAVEDCVVLYPSDAVAAEKLVEEAARHRGIVYLRTTRMETPIIYAANESFPIGGCKVLRQSDQDQVTLVAAGVTLHEALAAYDQLQQDGIKVRIIDLYSIKPLDQETLQKAAQQTAAIITVEDHHPEGGMGEAVRSALATAAVPVYSLAVRLKPRSGKPEELLDYEGISRAAIVRQVRELV